MDELGLKDSARANQLDCVISYLFQLHLMLYACVLRFDVKGTIGIFLETKALFSSRKSLGFVAVSHFVVT